MEKISLNIEELGLKDLKNLALKLELTTEAELKDKKLKKEDLQALIRDWEDAKTLNPSDEAVVEDDGTNLGTFQGKKVVKIEEKVINNKKYSEITVETGEVFTELNR